MFERLPQRLAGWRSVLAAFAFYQLLAILLTLPAIARLSTALVGQLGSDAHENVWFIWWVRESLLRSAASPALISILNHPAGQYVPLALTQLPAFLLPAILALWVSPAAAYNLAMLLAPALNAAAMFVFTLDLTKRRLAAFWGGLLFGFSPALWGHMTGGHLNIVWLVGFPVFAFFLRRLLLAGGWRNVTGTAFGALLACGHPNLPAYFLLPVALALAWAHADQLREARVRAALLAALALALALIMPLYWPMLAAARSVSETNTHVGGVVSQSVDLLSLFMPPPGHPLLRRSPLAALANSAVDTPYESIGYAGYAALLTAVFGVWALRGQRALRAWLVLLLAAGVLMLGPLLKVGGAALAVTVEGRAQSILLPYQALAQLPLFQWSRAPARFALTFHFALAVLGAYGVAQLLPRLRAAPAWLVVGALAAFSIGERLVALPFPLALQPASPVLTTLAAKCANSSRAVVNIPAGYTANYLALFGQTVHHCPLLGGRVFRGVPNGETSLDFVDALLRPGPAQDIVSRPTTEAVKRALQHYAVGYVFLQHLGEGYSEDQRNWLRSTFGEPAAAGDVESLFAAAPALTNGALPVWALAPGQWSDAQQWGSAPARWFSGSARIYLFLPQPQRGHLAFTAIPGLQLHRVEMLVNGTAAAAYAIGDWAPYASPTLDLPAGVNVIEFADRSGTENLVGDLRCLGGTPLAGKFAADVACNPHLKGARAVSVALQAVKFVPGPAQPPLAQFGSELQLLNAAWPLEVSSGTDLQVLLGWQALQKPGADYTFFIHVKDAAGQLVAQHDGQPLANNFSTLQWHAGDQISFHLRVPLPAQLPAGNYHLILGVYNAQTGTRLDTAQGTDGLLQLGAVRVRAP